MSKTRASCFIRGSRHLETIKALGLRPRAFICFSVSGTADETVALAFDKDGYNLELWQYTKTMFQTIQSSMRWNRSILVVTSSECPSYKHSLKRIKRQAKNKVTWPLKAGKQTKQGTQPLHPTPCELSEALQTQTRHGFPRLLSSSNKGMSINISVTVPILVCL